MNSRVTVVSLQGQIENARAAIFVGKELAHEEYRKRHVFEPACKPGLFLPRQICNRGETVVLVIFFAHGCQAIGFQGADKVFFERFFDVTHVFFGRKPEVEQDKAKLQLVFHANIQHASHQLVLWYQTGSLLFACFEITVLQWLPDQLKRHGHGGVSNMIEAIEQIEALHRLALAVIIMPTHHFVFVRIRLFLYGVIKDQDRLFPFYLADGGLDFLPQVFGGVFFIR